MTDGDRLSDLDEPLSEDRQSDDGPSAPQIETPRAKRPTTEAPSTRTEALRSQAETVDPALKTLFWKLVALYKLAILGLTLGLLLSVFRSHPTRGPALLVGGTALLVYAMVLTRRGKARLDAGEFDHGTDSTEDSP